MSSSTAQFETLRTLVYTSLTTSYVAVGTAFSDPIRIFRFVNTTDAIVTITADGVNASVILNPTSDAQYNISSNNVNNISFQFPGNSGFSAKYSGTPPTKGAISVEAVSSVS